MQFHQRAGIRRVLGTIVIGLVLSAAPSAATIVGGGGGKATDCLGVFDATVNTPSGKPRHIRCVDGQIGCDADGTVNGVCEIPVSVCANSTALPGCTLNGVASMTIEHAFDNGDPKFDPDFQALQSRITNDIQPPTTVADACISVATTFRVPIKGPVGNNHCGRRTKKVTLITLSEVSEGRVFKDTDTIKLSCAPADDTVGGCDPQILFTGTFDRIQKQVFNQSCAVSSCHDSQSQQANLLLETGASLANLISVNPDNAFAVAAGWKRVTQINASSGDASTSFLYRKVEGDFPDGNFGERMPRGRAKLNGTLRDVIKLWIEAGAPNTGWVPGTD